MKFKINRLALIVSGLFLSNMPAVQAADTTDLGQINVQGLPGGTSTGLIQQEESPKARSSVTAAAIEKKTPTSTAFQMIEALPGVSTFDQDGTGLFGGTLRVRGFNSNQMGLTLDGVPLNDSLNYTINIQEFADPENTCEVFLTQGSTDIDAPHVGASGGNIGISTCDPKDKLGGKVAYAVGSNSYHKEFVRFDSGRFMNDRAKFFVSLSQAGADKFKGDGKADREHLDAKAVFNFDGGSFSKLTGLYNKMNNANYRTVSKNDIANGGYDLDFGTRAPVHQPAVAGTAQNDTTYAPNAGIFGASGAQYAGFNNNPFENYQVALQNHWQISPKASIDVNPYYSYGYGTGGNQLTTVTESKASTALHGGIRDANGDGDTRDTVAMYGSNISETTRWGITAKANYQAGIHNVSGGIWFDRGTSKQYSPVVAIGNNGNSADYWLRNSSAYLQYQDGTPYNAARNWKTNVDAHTLFLQDSFGLLNDKLNVLLGLKRQTVARDFNNYASGSGVNANGVNYSEHQDFSDNLANLGLRYQFTDKQSAFFNAGQNARAPENSANTGLAQLTGKNYSTSIVNGVMVAKDAAGNVIPVNILAVNVKPEKSNNFDLGYRFAGEQLTFSGSAFYVDFKDRLSSQYDPTTNLTTQFNVGKSRTVGLELEAGYKVNSQWNVYSSLTRTESTMLEDRVFAKTTNGGSAALPTSGKQMPDTPKWLASLSLQYTYGSFYSSIQGRYVGARYTSLVNDDQVGGYTLYDIGAGYRFAPTAFMKTPTIRLTVSNLFSKQYLSMTGTSGSSFTSNVNPVVTAQGTVAGNISASGNATSPSFYVGAPRTLQISLSTDF
jgi:iron complex outermembrane receptor protein